jgi:hypothetical protein
MMKRSPISDMMCGKTLGMSRHVVHVVLDVIAGPPQRCEPSASAYLIDVNLTLHLKTGPRPGRAGVQAVEPFVAPIRFWLHVWYLLGYATDGCTKYTGIIRSKALCFSSFVPLIHLFERRRAAAGATWPRVAHAPFWHSRSKGENA